MVFRTIFYLLSLTRPLEWGKQFANMTIGYFTALFVLSSVSNVDWQLFAAAFIIIGPLFWGGLYVLNDWTDIQKDRKHSAKKERALAAEKVRPSIALAFGVFLVLLSFGFAFLINNALLLASMAAMLLNQWLYTMEPFYLKRRAFFDMVSGSVVNPVFRFLSGWALVTQSLAAVPLGIIVFVIAIQYVFYSFFRLSSRELEKEMGFDSTVVVFSEKTIIATAIFSFFIAIISYSFASITLLGERFLVPLLLSGILLPFYAKAMEHPEHIQFRKMKKIVYMHFFGFAILFAAMFFV